MKSPLLSVTSEKKPKSNFWQSLTGWVPKATFATSTNLGNSPRNSVWQACLDGPVVVAFADTLFRADFTIDPQADGVLFVKKVDNPRAFGVVVTDANGTIEDYVEKPAEFVSDLAMIGIYAFRDGKRLHSELQRLIDENIIKGGEYQLPDALRHMTQAGLRFEPGAVTEWMDCGNKAATVDTNQRILPSQRTNAHTIGCRNREQHRPASLFHRIRGSNSQLCRRASCQPW